LRLLASQRGRFSGEEFTGLGGARPGDPDVLENVFQVGVREV
jgi:hypothetical protein